MISMKKICSLALCLLSSWAIFGSAQAANLALKQIPLNIPEDYQAWAVPSKFKASGPTLLFSDSPEMVYHNGILYRDVAEGRVRLFFHHVNAVEGSKKLALMLKNKHMRPVHYKLLRQGVAGPGYNYMEVGKEAQRQYFAPEQNSLSQGSIAFGHSVELLSGRGMLLATNELVTGTLDLELDGPCEISFLMCEPRTDLEIFNDNAAVQPQDEHPLRGSFAKSDWEYTLKQSIKGTEPVKIKLAGSDGRGYSKGVDATTGLPAENYGNYGVLYRVNFIVESELPVSFILNPIGGYFAGYGVLQHEGGQQLLALPDYALALGERIEEAVELGRLKRGKYTFIWSPPGASNLPIELLWTTSRRGLRK